MRLTFFFRAEAGIRHRTVTGVQTCALPISATQAGCASGTGTCTVAPGIVLTSGAGQWWIVTANASGNGPWSSAMAFTVPGAPPPGTATLVAPAGSLATATPAFTWNARSEARRVGRACG